jgi:hypothetical protein
VRWNLSVVLICISFIARDGEHFFMCFLAIWISSFEKVLLVHFLLQVTQYHRLILAHGSGGPKMKNLIMGTPSNDQRPQPLSTIIRLCFCPPSSSQ